MSEHDELMSLADMSELDEQILAQSGEDDLLDRMQDKKNKQAEERSPWIKDLRDHWFGYLLLALSFLLTEMTAIYLGLAPVLQTNPDGSTVIHFHTDFGHIATTLVYMLVFPAVTEIAFAVAKKKFNTRETGNMAQQGAMLFASAVALISIIGTGVSGTYVIFTTLGSVGFLEVPPSVQNWLIWVMPVLIAIFGLCFWIYEATSRAAKARKLAEEEDQKAELADQTRMKQINRIGKRAIAASAIRTYEKAVSRGLLSQAEADEGLSQGLSLAQLETKLRRDLTGEGRIGDTSGLNTPQAPALPSPAPVPLLPRQGTYKAYSLADLLAYSGRTREQVRDMLTQASLLDSTSAFYALKEAGYIPADFYGDGDLGLAADRFRGLYTEIMGYTSLPLPVSNSLPRNNPLP
jgi:hypothetical protein